MGMIENQEVKEADLEEDSFNFISFDRIIANNKK